MDPILQDKLFQIATILLEIAIYILIPVMLKYFQKAKAAAEQKIGAGNLAVAEQLAGVVVKAVEQMHPELEGDGKFKLASELLSKWTEGKVSEEQITHLIEAAVKEMNFILKPPAIEQPAAQPLTAPGIGFVNGPTGQHTHEIIYSGCHTHPLNLSTPTP